MGLKLMAELGLDGSGFETGMRKAGGVARGMLSGLKGFVVASVGIATVETAIRKTVETADKLIDTSERLATTPERLQIISRAALQNATDLGGVANAFEKINIAREKALGGDQNANRAFRALGVTPEMLRSQRADQLFTGQLSTAARSMSPEQSGIAFREVIGKGFGPILSTLRTDFDALGKHMRDIGAIMDTETAVTLKTFKEELGLLTDIITSQLGPALIWFAEHLYKTLAGFAGLFGQLGGGVSKMSPTEIAASIGKAMLPTGWVDIGTKLASGKGLGESVFGPKYDTKAGESTAMDAIGRFLGPLEELKKRMAAIAKGLDNPPAPDFSKPTLGMKLSRADLIDKGDALTKTGNFLGGLNVSAIEKVKIDLLRQIANNTAHRVLTGVQAGVGGIGGMIGSMLGGARATKFPL